MFSPEEYTHFTSGRAFFLLGCFAASVGALCWVVSKNYPDKPSMPRRFPGGLDRELGGPGTIYVSLGFSLLRASSDKINDRPRMTRTMKTKQTGQPRIDQFQIQSRLCSAIILFYQILLRHKKDSQAPDIYRKALVVSSLTLISKPHANAMLIKQV